MQPLIMVIVCYLLCVFIRPIWKGFIVGALGYVIVLFLINMNSHSPNTKLNIADDSLGYFAAGGIGEFAAYFAIGCIIFIISPKFNKESEIETESETET